jgi:hypothetical protein
MYSLPEHTLTSPQTGGARDSVQQQQGSIPLPWTLLENYE